MAEKPAIQSIAKEAAQSGIEGLAGSPESSKRPWNLPCKKKNFSPGCKDLLSSWWQQKGEGRKMDALVVFRLNKKIIYF